MIKLRPMRVTIALTAALTWLAGLALAAGGEPLDMRDGPGAKGRMLSPVWRMACSGSDRLVGLRLHTDDRLAGVEAICAPLKATAGGTAWAREPSLWAPPAWMIAAPPPPVKTRQVKVIQEGTVLRASSDGVTRQRGSRAVIIDVKEELRRTARREAKPESDAGPAHPTTVAFRDARDATDLICPRGAFVRGLRLGLKQERRTERLAAVQLLCAFHEGGAVETVGAWPVEVAAKPTKSKRKRKTAAVPAALKVQRIECGRGSANPHDGAAARAIFGTVEDGRVQSIGLSCADRADPQARSTLYTDASSAVRDAARAIGWRRQFETPAWFDGRALAVCVAGKKTGDCAQDSADRWCASVAGYRHAIAFTIGRYEREAVTAAGETCAKGACRAFATITCGL